MRKTVLLALVFLLTASLCAKEKYLILTTDKYYQSEALNNFVDFRSNDFDVIVVRNSEIGEYPEQFKNYIIQQRPDYVLLVGNYSDFPSRPIPYSKPVESYNFWVAEQVDSLFQIKIPIGLFFIEDASELENIVAKTIKFEQNLDKIPKKLYTHSGDTPGKPVLPWPLGFCDEILNEMYELCFKPKGYTNQHESSLDDSPNNAFEDIKAINNGVKYILYHGHGNIQGWSYGMGVQGIEYLKNDEFFPIIVSASCLTGTFSRKIDTLEAPCFATNMLASENGAVAFIGAYNESSKGQNPFLYGFSANVNNNKYERLGDAIRDAFNSIEMPETVIKYFPHIMAFEYNRARLQFHLFGDPALKINLIDSKVINNEQTSEITISPNPASEYIEINCPFSFFDKGGSELASWGISEIKIYNTFGEMVMSESIHPMTPSHRMNIEQLPVGIYFIQIGNYSQKFMVVR